MSTPPAFSLGVTYSRLPDSRRLWPAFDSGAVRHDFAHIADLGCTLVQVPLHWEDVQPAPDRINPAVLRAFERLLDIAQANRLEVAVALFSGAHDDMVQVPAWATGAEQRRTARGTLELVADQPARTVLYADGYHEVPVRDLYSSRIIREAQYYLIDEVVATLRSTPRCGRGSLARASSRPACPNVRRLPPIGWMPCTNMPGCAGPSGSWVRFRSMG
ncbi:MAG: hypothetical protein HC828_10755 [Blastochloris sp.]|nr:hypothetical protein [Blastochloris sp.]